MRAGSVPTATNTRCSGRVCAVAAPPTPSRSPASTGSVRDDVVGHYSAPESQIVVSSQHVPHLFPPPPCAQVKRAMTMTEKILAKHSNNLSVAPGNNIWTSVDKLMTHDVCGPGTFGIFQREFGEDAQVWDPERVVIIPDHYIFTADPRANRNVDILR